MKQKVLIFVLGMHRSGTSVATHIVERLTNAHIGKKSELHAIHEDNPIGNNERLDIMAINDAMLADVKCSWCQVNSSFNPDLIPRKRYGECYELLKRITEDADQKRVLLKDPRFCLTWPVWYEAASKCLQEKIFDGVLCVYVNRNGREVSLSLDARDKIAHGDGLAICQIYKTWLEMWRYTKTFPGFALDFESLQQNPLQVIQQIYSKFVELGVCVPIANDEEKCTFLKKCNAFNDDFVHHRDKKVTDAPKADYEYQLLDVPEQTNRKIFVVTVHRLTEFWISIQKRYLKRHLPTAEVYAVVDNAKDVSQFTHGFSTKQLEKEKANYVRDFEMSERAKTQSITDHSTWLDVLFEKIKCAKSDDIVIFMDNDAFPIASLQYQFELLKTNKVVSVVRKENCNDQFPHPCFTMTTYGFWKENKLTWARRCKDMSLPNHDVGSALWEFLCKNNLSWHAMLRNNDRNLDSIMFGVYESVVYHHGAGSRFAVIRAHRHTNVTPKHAEDRKQQFMQVIRKDERFFLQLKDFDDYSHAQTSTFKPQPISSVAQPNFRAFAALPRNPIVQLKQNTLKSISQNYQHPLKQNTAKSISQTYQHSTPKPPSRLRRNNFLALAMSKRTALTKK